MSSEGDAQRISQDIVERLRSIAEAQGLSVDELLARSVRQWERRYDALEADATKLGELGWTIPTWTDKDQVRSILAAVQDDSVDHAILALYDAEAQHGTTARQHTESYHGALASWRPLLEQCWDAYER